MAERTPHIGTLREKPLHASLKRWYARPGDRIEVPVDGFVIDLVRDDLLIEIQTRGFSSMKRKTAALIDLGHHIRIVHPIPVDKWIIKLDDEGTVLDRRKSPKHGSPIDIFAELVSFPALIADPAFEVELVLTVEEEYRHHTPDRSWRRKGWSVSERRLVEITESVLLTDLRDLVGLLPEDLPETFTTSDLATRLSRPRRIAQQMAYCLREAGGIAPVAKRGNAFVYEAVDLPRTS